MYFKQIVSLHKCKLTIILYTLCKSFLQTSTHCLHPGRRRISRLRLGIVLIQQFSQKHGWSYKSATEHTHTHIAIHHHVDNYLQNPKFFILHYKKPRMYVIINNNANDTNTYYYCVAQYGRYLYLPVYFMILDPMINDSKIPNAWPNHWSG